MDLTRVSPCVSPEDVHRESSTAVGAIHKAMVSLRVELAKKNELITELREKIESKSSSATPHFEDVFVLQVGEDQDGGRGQVHKDQYDEILLYEESLAEKEASTADEARPRHDPVIAFVASDDDDDQLEKKHGLNIPLRLKKDFLLHPPPTSSSLRSAHSNSLSALSVSSRPILRPPSIEAKRSVASQTDVSALGTRLWSSEPLLDQIRHGFFLPELKIRRKLTSKRKSQSLLFLTFPNLRKSIFRQAILGLLERCQCRRPQRPLKLDQRICQMRENQASQLFGLGRDTGKFRKSLEQR